MERQIKSKFVLEGEPKAQSVENFCRSHGFSRAMFYRLRQMGRAPQTMTVGRRVLVSAEAAAQWRGEMQKR